MGNLRTTALLLGALAFSSCEAPSNVPTAPKEPTQEEMLSGIKDVTATLEAKTFAALVPDSVVREIVQEVLKRPLYGDRSNMSNAIARGEVFENELCPSFGNKCYAALYAAYSGGESHFKRDGIPLEAGEPLNQARNIILDKAREHLKDPQRLRAFYESKREIIIDELQKAAQTDAEKRELEDWLKNVEAGFEAFEKPAFKEALATYLAAEKASKDTPYEDPSSQVKYEAYMAAKTALEALTPDLYASLFAGRRAGENPDPALVDAYEAITRDLRGVVAN